MNHFTAPPLETRLDAVWDCTDPDAHRVWLRLAHPTDEITEDLRRELILRGQVMDIPDWRADGSLVVVDCEPSALTWHFINWWRWLIPTAEWVQEAPEVLRPLHRGVLNPRLGGGAA